MRTAILGGWSLALIVVLVLCSKMARRGEAVDKARAARAEIDEALRKAAAERQATAGKLRVDLYDKDGEPRETLFVGKDLYGRLMLALETSGAMARESERKGAR